MRLRNMLRICLVFWESEPQCAYKRYAYKKTCIKGLKKVMIIIFATVGNSLSLQRPCFFFLGRLIICCNQITIAGSGLNFDRGGGSKSIHIRFSTLSFPSVAR